MKILVLLLGLLATGASAASRFHERNHTGLLFLYAFDEGQVPTSPPTQVRDVSGRNLMGNLTASTSGAVSWSAMRQGMAIPSLGGGARAASQLRSSDVLSRLSSEFSLEFFFSSPSNPKSQSLLIAGFGDWQPGAAFAACDASNVVSEGGWRLSSRFGVGLEFDAVLEMNGEPTCVSNTFAVTSDTLRHLVIRGQAGILSVATHGGTSNIFGVNFAPTLWARHPAPLVIASPHATMGWLGTMYMVAMYDRYLSNAEIAANLALGPPNSFPYGGGTLEVDEDVSAALVDAV